MRRLQRSISLAVALILVSIMSVTVHADEPGLNSFKTINQYTAGQFVDVSEDQWYAENVKNAFELGLFMGSGDRFYPDNSITIAETLTVASRLHNTYFNNGFNFEQGTPWYQVYVDYAIQNGLIRSGDFTDYQTKSTRAQFASILSKTVAEKEFQVKNTIDDAAIPDVSMDSAYAKDVYKLYRAGILTGNDSKGTFTPDSQITRSAVAAIITRIVDPDLRQSITLRDPSWWEGNYRKPYQDYHEPIELSEEQREWFSEDAANERISKLIKTDEKYCYWEVLERGLTSGEMWYCRTLKDNSSSKVWVCWDIDRATEDDWMLSSTGNDIIDTMTISDLSGGWRYLGSNGEESHVYLHPYGFVVYDWNQNGLWGIEFSCINKSGSIYTITRSDSADNWNSFDNIDFINAAFTEVSSDKYVIASIKNDSIGYYLYTGPDYMSGSLNTVVKESTSDVKNTVNQIVADIETYAKNILIKNYGSGVDTDTDLEAHFKGYTYVNGEAYPTFEIYTTIVVDDSYYGTFHMNTIVEDDMGRGFIYRHYYWRTDY